MEPSTNISAFDIAKLAERYADAAAVHGEAMDHNDPERANHAYDELADALRELRKSGDGGRRALRGLLKHRNDSVRCWAATHLLKTDTWSAKWVLWRLALRSTHVGFNASIVLSEWRKGTLRIP